MIGSRAFERPEHYRFAREQSASMRNAVMETIEPLRPWGADVVSAACLVGFVGFVFVLLGIV